MKTPGESSSWGGGGGGGGGRSDKHFPCGREIVSIAAHPPHSSPFLPQTALGSLGAAQGVHTWKDFTWRTERERGGVNAHWKDAYNVQVPHTLAEYRQPCETIPIS